MEQIHPILTFDGKHLKILYVQYTNPACYPPLEHSSRILAGLGWQVMFLGIAVHGAETLEFPWHANIRVRRLISCRPGWHQKLHYAAFCVWACGWALFWRPKWVYASDPLACPVALLMSWIPGVRILYHEHDSPGLASEASGLFQRLVWRARSRLAARTESCILPNQQRIERFRTEVPGAQKILCVANCPRLEEIQPRRRTETDRPLVLYYHGNVSRSYVPPTLIEALKAAPPEVRLRVIGYETAGEEGYVEYLCGLAKALGVEDRVELLPALPRYGLLKHCSRGDVGLGVMPLKNPGFNEVYMVGASNKVFDYLACGLAVLVSDVPGWKSTYVDAGYGLSCIPEQTSSIADALWWFCEHRADTIAMGERGRTRIVSEWNYETQFATVLQLLQEAAGANLSGFRAKA